MGDPLDFEAFVVANGPGLIRFAYLLCRDSGRAEDLVQEALFRAHKRWSNTGEVEYPDAYVRQVVLRQYLGWRRRLASREIVGLGALDLVESDTSGIVADQDMIWRLMGTLPERQRAVLVLRYYQDLPDEQIAELLGCAQPTVRSLAARALAALRRDQADVDNPAETASEHTR